MDAARFDHWTRAIATSATRRQSGVALLLGAVAVTHGAAIIEAGPGCKNAGAPCKNAGQCCSGVCKGRKRRKKCKAHDTGGCAAGEATIGCGGTAEPCTTSSGNSGQCMTTTGNAAYCGSGGDCFLPCTTDAGCRRFCGPRAACIRCEIGCTVGTFCAGTGNCDFGP